MPSYPHIERYYEDKQRLLAFGGSGNEENIRPAFQNRLDAYCRGHREKLLLVPALIAATATVHTPTVTTRNESYFRQFGLEFKNLFEGSKQ